MWSFVCLWSAFGNEPLNIMLRGPAFVVAHASHILYTQLKLCEGEMHMLQHMHLSYFLKVLLKMFEA